MERCIIHPIQFHKHVCLYFQSGKPNSFRRCVSVSQKHFTPMIFKRLITHLVFFPRLLLHLISDWFSDTLFTSINALTILAFLIEAAVAHGHKEAFKAPCICFNMLPEAFRLSILKKWHFSRQSPFKQLHLID